MTTTGAGRPRLPDTDARIRKATLALIREQGPRAVNVASVAARSGVARTTIYRRYADRRALLASALAAVTAQGSAPEGLDLVGRLTWVLTATARVLEDHVGPGGVAAVLNNADPDFTSALRDSLALGLRPVVDQITADAANGALPAEVPPDVVVNLLVGAHLAESLRHGTPDSRWRVRTARALASLLSRDADGPSPPRD